MMPTAEARSEMPEVVAVCDGYSVTPRGERLRPGWAHPSPWHFLLHRRILEELLASDDLATGGQVLDLGWADRPYEEFFRRRFSEYVGVDLPGNPQADVSISADGRIPVADESADCLLSSQVLEYVPVPAAYLAEARSVFGFASSALQLWQDASAGFLPRPLRPLYYAVVQAAIGAIERWRPEPRSPNASVYLVLAKRT